MLLRVTLWHFTVIDVEIAIELCNALWVEELDAQLIGAIKHARLMTVAAGRDASDVTNAGSQFALVRVVVLLEQQIELLVVSRSI